MLYHVVRVRFAGRLSGIVLQNVNGPCPLLAIVNVLLLRGDLELHREQESVSYEEMALMLRQHLEKRVLQHGDDAVDEERMALALQEFEDCTALLPRLEQGVDVNVVFQDCTRFEYTGELAMFDAFGTRLVHGWVYDPQDRGTARVLGDLSYNQLVNFVTRDPATPEEGEDQAAARAFLERTAAQMTVAGLARLYQTLQEDQLCVLFRNNHFSTLLRHGDAVYALVTDQGIMAATRTVVWQRIGDIDGDDAFVDADFVRVREDQSNADGAGGGAPVAGDDAAMAAALAAADQEAASAAYAQQLQQQEYQQYQQQQQQQRQQQQQQQQRRQPRQPRQQRPPPPQPRDGHEKKKSSCALM